jgi:hypothetical protein
MAIAKRRLQDSSHLPGPARQRIADARHWLSDVDISANCSTPRPGLSRNIPVKEIGRCLPLSQRPTLHILASRLSETSRPVMGPMQAYRHFPSEVRIHFSKEGCRPRTGRRTLEQTWQTTRAWRDTPISTAEHAKAVPRLRILSVSPPSSLNEFPAKAIPDTTGRQCLQSGNAKRLSSAQNL